MCDLFKNYAKRTTKKKTKNQNTKFVFFFCQHNKQNKKDKTETHTTENWQRCALTDWLAHWLIDWTDQKTKERSSCCWCSYLGWILATAHSCEIWQRCTENWQCCSAFLCVYIFFFVACSFLTFIRFLFFSRIQLCKCYKQVTEMWQHCLRSSKFARPGHVHPQVIHIHIKHILQQYSNKENKYNNSTRIFKQK